jgi:hypothetical protein
MKANLHKLVYPMSSNYYKKPHSDKITSDVLHNDVISDVYFFPLNNHRKLDNDLVVIVFCV